MDFNAIAQGYTVDMLINFLLESGIENAMVELGGEVRCVGMNLKGLPWRIAVDKPVTNDGTGGRPLQAILEVQNASVCTSGNYRKFKEIEGVRVSHTIDPRTGYPAYHALLSVTILAESAAVADAYATAFMIMRLEEIIPIVEGGIHNLYALIVYKDAQGNLETYVSTNLEDKLLYPVPPQKD